MHRPLKSFAPLALLAFAVLACASRSETQPPPLAEANASATASPTAAELIAQADHLYAQREEPARLREALKFLRLAYAADLNNFEAAWRLSKFNYYLGSNTADEKERDAAFRDGVEAGRATVRIAPDKPDGHFWLAANLGGQAKAQGPLNAMATVPDIRREMETVIRIDETFMSGSAYTALAEIDLELPEILGGDVGRAVENLEKGLRVGADNPRVRLLLAKAYLAARRRDDARRQLDALLSMQPHPDYRPEHKQATAEARRLLERTK